MHKKVLLIAILGCQQIITAMNTGRTQLHRAVSRNDFEGVVSLIKKDRELLNAADSKGYTPLHEAAIFTRDSDIASCLIRAGAAINRTNTKGDTPLHSAVEYDNILVAELLLQNKAPVNVKNSTGETPLHYAAKNDRLKIAQLLIDHGAFIDSGDNNETPLYYATCHGNCDVAAILLNHGAASNVHINGESILDVAAKNNDIAMVKLLLPKTNDRTMLDKALDNATSCCAYATVRLLLDAGAKFITKNQACDIKTALLDKAAEQDDVALVKQLIDAGFDTNTVGGNMKNALHVAAEYASINVAKILIQANININQQQTGRGFTPTHSAIYYGDLLILQELINARADFTLSDKFGDTPLLLAIQLNRFDCVQELVEKAHVDVNKGNALTGTFPLHLALELQNAKIATYLIDHGACLTLTTKIGNTPLHSAAEQGLLDLTKTLIEKCSETINAQNNAGETPLHKAVAHGHHELACTLIDAQANIHAITKGNVQPLHLAAALSNKDMVVLLLGKGATCNPTTTEGATPLDKATNEVVALTLMDNGAKLNLSKQHAVIKSILHKAAQENNTVLAQRIFATNYAIDRNALYLAAQHDSYEVAKLFLNQLHLNSRNNAHDSAVINNALHTAARYNSYQVAQLLLDRGANPFHKPDPLCGKNALHVAIMNNSIGVIRLLLQTHPTTLHSVHDNAFKTPLSMALKQCNPITVRLLNNAGAGSPFNYESDPPTLVMAGMSLHATTARVFWENADEKTQLIGAAAQGDVDLVRQLLEKGVSPWTHNQHQQTLFDIVAVILEDTTLTKKQWDNYQEIIKLCTNALKRSYLLPALYTMRDSKGKLFSPLPKDMQILITLFTTTFGPDVSVANMKSVPPPPPPLPSVIHAAPATIQPPPPAAPPAMHAVPPAPPAWVQVHAPQRTSLVQFLLKPTFVMSFLLLQCALVVGSYLMSSSTPDNFSTDFLARLITGCLERGYYTTAYNLAQRNQSQLATLSPETKQDIIKLIDDLIIKEYEETSALWNILEPLLSRCYLIELKNMLDTPPPPIAETA